MPANFVSPCSSPHLVVIPFKDKGHIMPMMMLAKKLALLGVSITVIFPEKESYSLVTEGGKLGGGGGLDMRMAVLDDSRDKGEALEEELERMKRSQSPPVAVLVDIIAIWTQEALKRSNLPRYVLYTAGCSNLAVMLRLRHPPGIEKMDKVVKEQLQQPPDAELDAFCKHNWREDLLESQGILVNSSYELEMEATDTIRREGKEYVLPIGPLLPEELLIDETSSHSMAESIIRSSDDARCKEWMDKQDPSSVVYVSFGSRTYLPEEQVRELAMGLEASNQKFLWVLPTPPSSRSSSEYLTGVLPEGFEARTAKQGMIVSGWAPQHLILRHAALGGFVTHCGWNSVLEGICLAGAPMLCWPFDADQPSNCRLIVDSLRVGLELNQSEDGIVRSGEVESKVRALVAGAEAEAMKCRLVKIKEMTRSSVRDGGSSVKNLKRFARDIWERFEKKVM